MDAVPRIETLDRRQCLDLLRRASVGRFAFSVPDGPPGVVPVSYVVDGAQGDEAVVVRTSHGSQVGRAAIGQQVAFEVDDIRTSQHEGWSVVVTGRAVEVDDDADAERLSGRLRAWAPGIKDLFLCIPVEQVTGRMVSSRERVIQLPEAPPPRWRDAQGWAPATRTPAHYTTDFDGR